MCDKGDLITCACCGYRTVYDQYQSCDICRWECDYGQESEPDYPFGANGRITLREAQQNYIRFGAFCEEFRGEGGSPRPEDLCDPDWRPFPAKPDPVEDAKAWRRIPPPLKPRTCLCCGFATIFHERDVCRICRWAFEYGYEPDPYLRFPGRNEGLCLYEAQQNYQNLAVFSEKYLHLKTEPRPDDKRGTWWKPAEPPSDPSEFKTYVGLPEVTCPCCGYLTPDYPNHSCKFCRWQRNPEQERDPDTRPSGKGNTNDVTFRQAQQNFLAFGKCSRKYVVDDPDLRKQLTNYAPGPDDVRDPNWKPLPPKEGDT